MATRFLGPVLGRRGFAAGLAASAVGRAWGAGSATVNLGILKFGTVQWVADVILRHGLDRAHGFSLHTTQLASTEAAKVALMGRAVDVAVSDWPFVAAQRSHGGTLTFSPFSSSLGGVMVPAASAVRRLADLRGKRLGVAGGPADKSWLIVRAAAQVQGLDVAREAELSFGAPPLLNASLEHGGLDALLTFWNFAARLRAAGWREAVSVAECSKILGLDRPPVLVGYVFDVGWAIMHRPAIEGLLAASAAAQNLLATQPGEWAAIRPLMDVPNDAVFANLRADFLAGLALTDAGAMSGQARRLLEVLSAQGVLPPTSLPEGVFWRGA